MDVFSPEKVDMEEGQRVRPSRTVLNRVSHQSCLLAFLALKSKVSDQKRDCLLIGNTIDNQQGFFLVSHIGVGGDDIGIRVGFDDAAKKMEARVRPAKIRRFRMELNCMVVACKPSFMIGLF